MLSDERNLAVAFLAHSAAKRLAIDLIAAEQNRLLREGRLSRAQHISRFLTKPDDDVSGLEIDEDTLGFDSLSLLDLVSAFTGYFALSDSGAEDLLVVNRGLDDWAEIIVRHFERVGSSARIGFLTSGSTGPSKRIFHARDVLEAEEKEIVASFLGPIFEPTRVLSCVAPRHIYGFLWGLLLPQTEGIPACDLHRSPIESLFREVRSGDVVLGTPFTWGRAASCGRSLPGGVTGVTAGAPSTPETWAAARTLGLTRFVEIFGATETGGVGWRTAADMPFRLSARFERAAGGDLLRVTTGERIALQDLLDWRDDQAFVVLGRRDSVVQIAGTNVSLAQITSLLRAVEGVMDAAVRVEGDRLKALIVPERGDTPRDQLEDMLRQVLRRSLPPPARPDRFAFAEELPRTEAGKLADW